jgi:four helix bundle protein
LTVPARAAATGVARASSSCGAAAAGEKEITMLRIVDTIIELIADVAPLAEQVGRKDANLAKQLRDALSSAALNTAEGSDQRGARRTNHYAIALGSTREAHVALRAAVAWGHIAPIPFRVTDRFGKVIGTLTKLVASKAPKAL